MFAAASHPVVLVDACCGRFGMQPVVRKLVEGCGIRFFTTPMGKALLDEHHPLYGGCYAGANSLEAVRKEVEAADFALYVGALKSDFNSGSFSVGIDPKVIVELHSFTTTVGVCLPSMATADDSMLNSLLPIFDTFYLYSSLHSRKPMPSPRARH
jgi:pyruvate decarboxylase